MYSEYVTEQAVVAWLLRLVTARLGQVDLYSSSVMIGVFGDINLRGCMPQVVDCGLERGFRGHQFVVLHGSGLWLCRVFSGT